MASQTRDSKRPGDPDCQARLRPACASSFLHQAPVWLSHAEGRAASGRHQDPAVLPAVRGDASLFPASAAGCRKATIRANIRGSPARLHDSITAPAHPRVSALPQCKKRPKSARQQHPLQPESAPWKKPGTRFCCLQQTALPESDTARTVLPPGRPLPFVSFPARRRGRNRASVRDGIYDAVPAGVFQ